jgi:hypothetical protein
MLSATGLGAFITPTSLFAVGENTYMEAVKDALKRRPGAEHLLQATTDVSSMGIPLLYQRVCIQTRGIAIKFRNPDLEMPERAPSPLPRAPERSR